jgi:hypothetical protein
VRHQPGLEHVVEHFAVEHDVDLVRLFPIGVSIVSGCARGHSRQW